MANLIFLHVETSALRAGDAVAVEAVHYCTDKKDVISRLGLILKPHDPAAIWDARAETVSLINHATASFYGFDQTVAFNSVRSYIESVDDPTLVFASQRYVVDLSFLATLGLHVEYMDLMTIVRFYLMKYWQGVSDDIRYMLSINKLLRNWKIPFHQQLPFQTSTGQEIMSRGMAYRASQVFKHLLESSKT